MKKQASIDEAGTLCRSFGHAWMNINGTAKTIRDWSAIRVKGGKGSWDISIQCERCTTKRYDIISPTGELLKRKYIYPLGYQRSRIPRSELRLELKTALRVWGSEKEMELWT